MIGYQKKRDKDQDEMDDSEYLVLREYKKFKEKNQQVHDKQFIERNKNFDQFKLVQWQRRQD